MNTTTARTLRVQHAALLANIDAALAAAVDLPAPAQQRGEAWSTYERRFSAFAELVGFVEFVAGTTRFRVLNTQDFLHRFAAKVKPGHGWKTPRAPRVGRERETHRAMRQTDEQTARRRYGHASDADLIELAARLHRDTIQLAKDIANGRESNYTNHLTRCAEDVECAQREMVRRGLLDATDWDKVNAEPEVETLADDATAPLFDATAPDATTPANDAMVPVPPNDCADDRYSAHWIPVLSPCGETGWRALRFLSTSDGHPVEDWTDARQLLTFASKEAAQRRCDELNDPNRCHALALAEERARQREICGTTVPVPANDCTPPVLDGDGHWLHWTPATGSRGRGAWRAHRYLGTLHGHPYHGVEDWTDKRRMRTFATREAAQRRCDELNDPDRCHALALAEERARQRKICGTTVPVPARNSRTRARFDVFTGTWVPVPAVAA